MNERDSQVAKRETLIDMHVDREKSFAAQERNSKVNSYENEITPELINPSVAKGTSLASPSKLSPVLSPS